MRHNPLKILQFHNMSKFSCALKYVYEFGILSLQLCFSPTASAFYGLKSKLQPLYDEREAEAIAHEVLYFVTGHNKTERLLLKETPFR